MTPFAVFSISPLAQLQSLVDRLSFMLQSLSPLGASLHKVLGTRTHSHPFQVENVWMTAGWVFSQPIAHTFPPHLLLCMECFPIDRRSFRLVMVQRLTSRPTDLR